MGIARLVLLYRLRLVIWRLQHSILREVDTGTSQTATLFQDNSLHHFDHTCFQKKASTLLRHGVLRWFVRMCRTPANPDVRQLYSYSVRYFGCGSFIVASHSFRWVISWARCFLSLPVSLAQFAVPAVFHPFTEKRVLM